MKRLLALLGLTATLYALPVSAQFANECRFGFCSPEPIASVTPETEACSVIAGTETVFTAQGTGPANATRVTIISINWGDSTLAGTAELSTVTLDGTQMARAVRASGNDQNSNSEIWWVQNPTGTTANIVVNSSTAITGITIGVYSLIGYRSISPIAFTTGTTSVSQSYSNRQVALAAASRTVNISTSLSNMTNDFSSDCGPDLWGVHASRALNGNNQTLNSAISPTSDNPKIALAVWAVAPPAACTPTGLDFSINCNGVLIPALIH